MKMSLDEFLGQRCLSFPMSGYMLDKCVCPHGLTLRQKEKLKKDNLKNANDYSQRRNAAIEEYNILVQKGEIQPKTSTELLIEHALFGHPDNASTQAARRMCQKRHINLEEFNKI